MLLEKVNSQKQLNPPRQSSILKDEDGENEVDSDGGKYDARFHRVFALAMHAGQTYATYYFFLMTRYPQDFILERKCAILGPFTILSWMLVLMGTDKIDSKLDIELGGGKNWVAVVKFFARSPNILYATVNCVIQRVSVLIAMIELGHPQYIFAAASVIVGLFIAGKSLYRQRVKIANTIKPEEMDKETTVQNRR